VKKITHDYDNLNNKGRRTIFYKGTRNTSKSMIGRGKVKKNDSLKVSSFNRRNKMSMRNHSMKRISGDEKKPVKLLPEFIGRKKRYHIKKEVGRGKQGIVYSAIDSVDNRKVAIKIITDDEDERERFKTEVNILEKIKKLGKDKSFPEIISIELNKKFYFISELLGYSLMDIQNKFNSCSGFTIKTVIMIGIQLLDRIKTFHSLGFVHGDIKPANIMFGKGNQKNMLYLIDYGLSKEESTCSKPIIPPSVYNKAMLQLNGTPLYASISSHLGWTKMFKKDDMDSFIYMLINISKDSPVLPWFKLPIMSDKYNNILCSKMKVTSEEICKGMPQEFKIMYEYIIGLSHLDVIDYDKIEKLLLDAAKNTDSNIHENFKYHKFHWLLESKRNTDGIFYQENRTHLQSCDSVLRNNSDEILKSLDLVSFKQNPKEELKMSKSPTEVKKDKKPKKKPKRNGLSKKTPLSMSKSYASHIDHSYINRNIHKIGSPGFLHPNKIQARDFKNKEIGMLDVNANNINESQNSALSSPNKLKAENNVNFNVNLPMQKIEKSKKIETSDNRAMVKKLPIETLINDSYMDLNEDFISEFDYQIETNKPKKFEHHSMDLKSINSGRGNKGRN
jgi:serine/threonine protein kinase